MLQRVRASHGCANLALLVAAMLTLPACVSTVPAGLGRPPLAATVRVRNAGSVVQVPLEEYVRVVILSEFTPGRGNVEAIARMLEVQAIVSRTYARVARHPDEPFDLCATTHCQLYEPRRVAASPWTGAAMDAVRRTAGVLVWSGDTPARIVFHADCGGHTSAARDVWSGDDPAYLAGMRDDGPANAAHAAWRFAPAGPELIAALNADARTRVGNRLDRIDVVRRDRAGRAQLVILDGERAPVVGGEELRVVINRRFGARAVRSTRFDVISTEGGFEFTGSGFGHGVGLCQAGAFARIAAGASAREVIAHYFPGTSIR